MIQDIGPLRKEGLASCLRVPSCVLRSLLTRQFALSLSFFLSALRIPDGSVSHILFACRTVENTRFLSPSMNRLSESVAIKVLPTLQDDASITVSRKDKCVLYSALRDFPSFVQRNNITLAGLTLLPRVKLNTGLMRRTTNCIFRNLLFIYLYEFKTIRINICIFNKIKYFNY